MVRGAELVGAWTLAVLSERGALGPILVPGGLRAESRPGGKPTPRPCPAGR